MLNHRYHWIYVATESACPIWTCNSVLEQMPVKGMVVSLSLARSVDSPESLASLPIPLQAV